MLLIHFVIICTFTLVFFMTSVLMFPNEMVSYKGITPEHSISVDESSPLSGKIVWTTYF